MNDLKGEYFYNIKTGQKQHFENWQAIVNLGGLNVLIDKDSYNLKAAYEYLSSPKVVFGSTAALDWAIKTVNAYKQ